MHRYFTGLILTLSVLLTGCFQAPMNERPFTGELQEVNTSCFFDGECYVVVDGKHITTAIGWSGEDVGSIKGVDSFGDLERFIGAQMEVYALREDDNRYTLYGNKDYYIELK